MRQSKLKFVTILLLLLAMCLPIGVFAGCDSGTGKTVEFYDTVVESQTRLDEIGDDIYSYWYDAIYKDKYYGSIDIAIATALSDNSENVNFVKENETKIQSLYKQVRDSDLKVEIKAVMSAYTEYYEFVMNVSGSFNSYSANKENYKKALATALKDLSMEL